MEYATQGRLSLTLTLIKMLAQAIKSRIGQSRGNASWMIKRLKRDETSTRPMMIERDRDRRAIPVPSADPSSRS